MNDDIKRNFKLTNAQQIRKKKEINEITLLQNYLTILKSLTES